MVVCGPDGVAVFEALHGERRLPEAFLYAFDLLGLDRRSCGQGYFSERKAKLGSLFVGGGTGVRRRAYPVWAQT